MEDQSSRWLEAPHVKWLDLIGSSSMEPDASNPIYLWIGSEITLTLEGVLYCGPHHTPLDPPAAFPAAGIRTYQFTASAYVWYQWTTTVEMMIKRYIPFYMKALMWALKGPKAVEAINKAMDGASMLYQAKQAIEAMPEVACALQAGSTSKSIDLGTFCFKRDWHLLSWTWGRGGMGTSGIWA